MKTTQMLTLGAAGASVGAAAAEPDLDAAFEKLPANDVDTAVQVCKELLAGGAATIKKLIVGVGEEFGDPNGVKPKYALHGVVVYAARPKGDKDRALVAETLAAELSAKHSDELKAFLCRQLQLCGRTDEVGALAKLLTSERLCEPATQALLAIGGKDATAALRAALPKADGKRRVTILYALGRQRDKESAANVRKFAGADDWTVRLAALYALSRMPDAASADAAFKAAQTKPSYNRARAVDAYLTLCQRMGAEGEADQAAANVRRFAERKDLAPHERCGAVHALAMGAGAVKDVLAALDVREPRVRIAAARTAVQLAKRLQKDNPAEAGKLLKKVLSATEEKALLLAAEQLLGRKPS